MLSPFNTHKKGIFFFFLHCIHYLRCTTLRSTILLWCFWCPELTTTVRSIPKYFLLVLCSHLHHDSGFLKLYLRIFGIQRKLLSSPLAFLWCLVNREGFWCWTFQEIVYLFVGFFSWIWPFVSLSKYLILCSYVHLFLL